MSTETEQVRWYTASAPGGKVHAVRSPMRSHKPSWAVRDSICSHLDWQPVVTEGYRMDEVDCRWCLKNLDQWDRVRLDR